MPSASLSPKKKRQWQHIYDSAIKAGKSVATAHKMANGVVGGAPKRGKDYVETWDVQQRQLTQQEANYNPVGGNNERACANCNWFVPSADSCVLISGDIVATGMSDYWIEAHAYEQMPMPVYMVDDPATAKSLGDKIKDFVNGLFGIDSDAEVSSIVFADKAFTTFKDIHGDLRWIARPTNNFRDKQKEIICEDAHKEFVDWCDNNNTYPELWLWHSKGSAFGKTDFLDVVDGFLIASGIIYKDSEGVAQQLSDDPDVAMSHGFLYRQEKDTILQYRSWELSCLPRTYAANEATDFGVYDMPFKPEKKEWLKGIVGAERADLLEQDTKELAEKLKGMGIDWKDDDTEPTPEPQPEPTPTPDAPAPTLTDVLQRLNGFSDDIEAMKIAIATTSQTVKAINTDIDSQVAAHLRAPVTQVATGDRPSQSPATMTTEPIKQKDTEWFAGVIQGAVELSNGGVR